MGNFIKITLLWAQDLCTRPFYKQDLWVPLFCPLCCSQPPFSLTNFFPLLHCRVMIHVVAQCHEEGLEHYLRSYVKVKFTAHLISQLSLYCFFSGYRTDMALYVPLMQYVFKTEPYTASTTKTVHEELAKAMTAILKPSTDFLTSNKLLKVKYCLKDLFDYLVYNCHGHEFHLYSSLTGAYFCLCPAVLLVFLWSLSQVHGSVLDWEL